MTTLTRRTLLKGLTLSFVPVLGPVASPATLGRITLSHQGVVVAEQGIAFALNSAMLLRIQDVVEPVAFDGCELYLPGDALPILRRSFEPHHVAPGMSLDLPWSDPGRCPFV